MGLVLTFSGLCVILFFLSPPLPVLDPSLHSLISKHVTFFILYFDIILVFKIEYILFVLQQFHTCKPQFHMYKLFHLAHYMPGGRRGIASMGSKDINKSHIIGSLMNQGFRTRTQGVLFLLTAPRKGQSGVYKHKIYIYYQVTVIIFTN